MKLINIYLTAEQISKLKRIKNEKGIPVAVQIRIILDAHFSTKSGKITKDNGDELPGLF